MLAGVIHVHDVTAWIATVIGAITLVSLLATFAVRAIKNETIKAVTENNEALKERAGELGAEKDQLLQNLSEVKGQRRALEEQIRQTPDFTEVVRLFNEGIAHLDDVAAKRQETFVELVMKEIVSHNVLVAKHYEEMEQIERDRKEVNHEILTAIEGLTKAVERMGR